MSSQNVFLSIGESGEEVETPSGFLDISPHHVLPTRKEVRVTNPTMKKLSLVGGTVV